MDIKNLLTFIHVAEVGNFTKAAQLLGYSQSTVSTQIKQLENDLNTQLFERIYHTIVLTDEGKEVLNYAHQIMNMTQSLEANLHNPTTLKGYIKIALADSLTYTLLNDQFCQFIKDHPQITLNMSTAGTQDLFQLLNHNEVDMILTLDSHIYDTNYVIVKEEKIAVKFVVSHEHPLAADKHINIEKLIQYPFILTEKGMSYRRIFDERLAERSLEVKPILELGSTHLICSLVEQGLGVSLLPEYVCEEGIKKGQLKYLDIDDFDIYVWKQLLYHKDKWITPAMEAIMQYM